MTLCRTCSEPLTEENTYKNYKKSYDYECKPCKRDRNKLNREKRGEGWLNYRREDNRKRVKEKRCFHLRKTYGITLKEWERIFKEQGYKCKICQTQEKPSMGWHTDHNHSTGKVRGILCHSCNTGLGKFRDDIKILEAAVSYLEEDLV